MFPCHPPSRRRWARPPAPACLRNSRKRAISSQTGGDSGPAGPPHTPPAARARAPPPAGWSGKVRARQPTLRPYVGRGESAGAAVTYWGPPPEARGWRPFDLRKETRASSRPSGFALCRPEWVGDGGGRGSAAPGPELQSPIFSSAISAHNSRQPLPAPRSQLQGLGAGVPARPEWRLRAPPAPAAGLCAVRRGGGLLIVVAEGQEHLIGQQEGSSRLTPGYLRAPAVAWGEEGSGVTRGQPSSGTALGPAEAARGGARASGPRDCGGGGGAAARSTLPRLPPRRGSRSGALCVWQRRLRLALGWGPRGGLGPAPTGNGGEAGAKGPAGMAARSQPPSTPPPLIWRAREAQLGAPAPAWERPAPPAQLTRGPRNAEPSLAVPRGVCGPAPPPRLRPALGPRQAARPRGTRAD
uniref:translation initiation factor IF-2 n=1 Tax=Callithrix jacchus TaxID=9483 RepID=UPI0023DD3392|nr:translation initiation factor IF-2 [Callithrix jacchus]